MKIARAGSGFAWTVFGLAAAGAVGMTGCTDSINDKDIQSLALTDVQRLTDKEGHKVLLLDTRLPSAYAAGHIPGAVNIPKAGVEADKDKLAPELADPKYVIVYGDNPGDGYAAATTKRLLRAGQSGARLYAGGIADWTRAGLKLEQSPAADGSAKK